VLATAPKAMLCPAGIAERLSVTTPDVLRFINSGELVAVNVASPGARAKRWRIDPADLEAFLLRRRSQPATARTRKRKQRQLQAAGTVEFY
jgi:helix-turn-helix protein